MRILLLSEGESEGRRNPDWPQALRTLVNKLLELGDDAYEWLDVHELPRRNPLKGEGRRYVGVGLKALRYAQEKQFAAVVLVADADRKHDRIVEFAEAQEHLAVFNIPRAFGIAVETFDAWMLADHQALTRVLKKQVHPMALPETFTGGKGKPNHPKVVCQKLMAEHQWAGSPAAFYEAVSQEADLDVLADRCPKGFKPFLDRLRTLAEQLPSEAE
jgi:hypothetical protein